MKGVLQAFLPSSGRRRVSGPRPPPPRSASRRSPTSPGQVLGGWLSDRFGRRVVGLAAAVLVAGGVVAAIGLVASQPDSSRCSGIALHGLGTGATIAVRSAAFSDVFGGANFGTIFGLLAVAYPIGGALAVYLGAVAFDATGSYLALIPVVLVAVAIWAVSLWVAGPRRSRTASARA